MRLCHSKCDKSMYNWKDSKLMTVLVIFIENEDGVGSERSVGMATVVVGMARDGYRRWQVAGRILTFVETRSCGKGSCL
ncbi:hypothetical protein BUY46_04205 [Staphylococcus devriesei]|nr:hypothetical protein BUY46_04205 [Staphylococcus devriesei]